ncbi:hypothetical protein [Paenibacillus sp.]|uniref:hypothetical protein n=1 Tax=Paenibacillus sp. TaxID=58172 RepID=UPI002D59133B|nr:hypothetical protein [Paenibacillus sp.]HZG85679.1 hypothetical protein [Paenibacillus sp.]
MSKRGGLGEVLVRTGRDLYHEIVRVAGYSLLSSAVLLPLLFFVPTTIALALLPALYAPLVYGVIAAFHRRAEGKPWGVRTVLAEAARGFGPAAVFGLLLAALAGILVSSWWYYGGQDGVLPLTLAVFQTYFVAMALVSQFYTLPLVISGRCGVFRAMGESAKLFFRHPGYTVGAFLQFVVVTIALLATLVGFGVLWAGTIGLFLQKAAANVLEPEDEGAAQEETTCLGS